MSAEEKFTNNLETTELPKFKRRFKLDRKHIQGFIAGILFCAIAFTGLYYGTDGRFFAGTVSGIIPVVTDANFESVLEQPDRYVIVISSNYYGEDRPKDSFWMQYIQLQSDLVNEFKEILNLNNDKLIIVELDETKSYKIISKYSLAYKDPTKAIYAVFYNGQKIYSCQYGRDLFDWLEQRSRQGLL